MLVGGCVELLIMHILTPIHHSLCKVCMVCKLIQCMFCDYRIEGGLYSIEDIMSSFGTILIKKERTKEEKKAEERKEKYKKKRGLTGRDRSAKEARPVSDRSAMHVWRY